MVYKNSLFPHHNKQPDSIPTVQVCDATGASWYSYRWSPKEKTAIPAGDDGLGIEAYLYIYVGVVKQEVGHFLVHAKAAGSVYKAHL